MTEAWASPADAVIPLAVTGTVVDSPQYANVADIISEIAAARGTERGGRADDKRSETAMEDRKREGYF